MPNLTVVVSSGNFYAYDGSIELEDYQKKGTIYENCTIICQSQSKKMTVEQAKNEGYELQSIHTPQANALAQNKVMLGNISGVTKSHFEKPYTCSQHHKNIFDETQKQVIIYVSKYELKEGKTLQMMQEEADRVFASQKNGSWSNLHYLNKVD